jgi:hypothetical protein
MFPAFDSASDVGKEKLMKRIVSFITLVLLAAQCFAQEGEQTQKQETQQPQIAYRILNDYVTQEQAKANDKTWSYIMLGTGGALMAGSAGVWFFGPQITAINPDWTPDVTTIVTVSLAGAGVATAGVGLVGALIPPVDVRTQYASVYGEQDSVVQEAMATAALKDIADRGRNARITGAIVGIGTPILTVATQVIINVCMGSEWYDNLASVSTWQIPWLVSGITDLFSLSSGERLYEKYLAARSAIYASQ